MRYKLLSCLAMGISLLSFNSTIQAYPKYFGYGEPSIQAVNETKDHTNIVHAYGENEAEIIALLRLAKQHNLKAVVVIGSILFRESGAYTSYIVTNEKKIKWDAFIERLRREGYLVTKKPEESTVVAFYVDEPDLYGIADIGNQPNPEVTKLVNLIKGNYYTDNFPIATAVSRLYKLGPGEINEHGEQCSNTTTRNCKFTEGLKLFDWVGITAYLSDDQAYLRELDEMEVNYSGKKKILIPKACLESSNPANTFTHNPDVFYPHVVNNPNVIGIVPFLWQTRCDTVDCYPGLTSPSLEGRRNQYIRMGYEISYKPQIVRQDIPPTMVVGTLYNVSVTLKNNGTKTWQRGKVRLGTKSPDNNTIWGTNRLDLPHDVLPGGTVVVSALVGTPTGERGTFPLQVQLIVDEQYWIGNPSELVNVVVQKPGDEYQAMYRPTYIGNTIPSYMQIGQLHDISVTFKNNGTETWPRGKVRLGTKSPDNNTIWGTNRLDLPYNVPPGQQVTISAKVGTPHGTPGTYPLQVQLIVDEQYWIGDTSPLIYVRTGY